LEKHNEIQWIVQTADCAELAQDRLGNKELGNQRYGLADSKGRRWLKSYIAWILCARNPGAMVRHSNTGVAIHAAREVFSHSKKRSSARRVIHHNLPWILFGSRAVKWL